MNESITFSRPISAVNYLFLRPIPIPIISCLSIGRFVHFHLHPCLALPSPWQNRPSPAAFCLRPAVWPFVSVSAISFQNPPPSFPSIYSIHPSFSFACLLPCCHSSSISVSVICCNSSIHRSPRLDSPIFLLSSLFSQSSSNQLPVFQSIYRLLQSNRH